MSVRVVHLDDYSMRQLCVSIQKDENRPNKYKCIPTFGELQEEDEPAVAYRPYIHKDEVLIEFQKVDLTNLSEKQIIEIFINCKRQSLKQKHVRFKKIVECNEGI